MGRTHFRDIALGSVQLKLEEGLAAFDELRQAAMLAESGKRSARELLPRGLKTHSCLISFSPATEIGYTLAMHSGDLKFEPASHIVGLGAFPCLNLIARVIVRSADQETVRRER
jgi:hypothetical protein